MLAAHAVALAVSFSATVLVTTYECPTSPDSNRMEVQLYTM